MSDEENIENKSVDVIENVDAEQKPEAPPKTNLENKNNEVEKNTIIDDKLLKKLQQENISLRKRLKEFMPNEDQAKDNARAATQVDSQQEKSLLDTASLKEKLQLEFESAKQEMLKMTEALKSEILNNKLDSFLDTHLAKHGAIDKDVKNLINKSELLKSGIVEEENVIKAIEDFKNSKPMFFKKQFNTNNVTEKPDPAASGTTDVNVKGAAKTKQDFEEIFNQIKKGAFKKK